MAQGRRGLISQVIQSGKVPHTSTTRSDVAQEIATFGVDTEADKKAKAKARARSQSLGPVLAARGVSGSSANKRNITPLEFEFDASNITGVSNGGDVIVWPEFSHARHATINDTFRTPSNHAPKLTTSAIGGKPAVTFDGVTGGGLWWSEYGTPNHVARVNGLPLTFREFFTIICVYQNQAVKASDIALGTINRMAWTINSFDTGSVLAERAWQIYAQGGFVNWNIFNGESGKDFAYDDVGPPPTGFVDPYDLNPHIMTYVQNGNKADAYLDGAHPVFFEGNVSRTDLTISGSGIMGELNIGHRASARPWLGHIAYLAIFSTALDQSDWFSRLQTLAAKYSITIAAVPH